MIVTLAMLKNEVGRQDTSDDLSLARKLSAAEALVVKYLRHPDYMGENIDWPSDIGEAVILAAVSLYDYPGEDPINSTVRSILDPHRYILVAQ